MADVVSIALDHAPRRLGNTAVTEWKVTFLNGTTHSGALTYVDKDVYRINKADGSVVFFAATSVVYLLPHE
jgi:hypothetical protein